MSLEDESVPYKVRWSFGIGELSRGLGIIRQATAIEERIELDFCRESGDGRQALVRHRNRWVSLGMHLAPGGCGHEVNILEPCRHLAPGGSSGQQSCLVLGRPSESGVLQLCTGGPEGHQMAAESRDPSYRGVL